jgi:hypothetical protein
MFEGGRQGLLDKANLQGQFLQTAQRSFRFVQVVDFLLDTQFQRLVGVLYLELLHFLGP